MRLLIVSQKLARLSCRKTLDFCSLSELFLSSSPKPYTLYRLSFINHGECFGLCHYISDLEEQHDLILCLRFSVPFKSFVSLKFLQGSLLTWEKILISLFFKLQFGL